MGSSSVSISKTEYSNTPLTLDNNENGLALAGNRDTLLGGLGNIAGSRNAGNTTRSGNYTNNSRLINKGQYTNNILDGGAINRAFDFGDQVVTVLAGLTKQQNQEQSASNSANYGFGSVVADGAEGEAAAAENGAAGLDFSNKKTMGILLITAFAVTWYFSKKG